MDDYEWLPYFMACYMHQDWDCGHDDEWGAVDDFVRDEVPEARAIAREIDDLLLAHPGELELEDLVHHWGAEFIANADGGTYRGWLEGIARRVRDHREMTSG